MPDVLFDIGGSLCPLPDDYAQHLAVELRRLALDDVEFEGTSGNAVGLAVAIEHALETGATVTPTVLEAIEFYRLVDVQLASRGKAGSLPALVDLGEALQRFLHEQGLM